MTKHRKPHDTPAAPEPAEVAGAGGGVENGAAEAWTEETPVDAPPDRDGELARWREEAAQANDRWLRTRAEFDNYRRRTLQDQGRLREAAVERAVLALLPALDDLDRLRQTAAAGMDQEGLSRGLELVAARVSAQLEQLGVRAFASVGQVFDPVYHEALSVCARDDAADGVIVDEHVRGYQRGETVIRHAQVIVNKR